MKYRRTHLSELSIKWKLLLIYFFVGVVPIMSIGIYSLYNRYENMIQFEERQMADYCQTMKNNLFAMTSLCYSISQILRYDGELQSLLGRDYTVENEAYDACRKYKVMDMFNAYYTEIADIQLYTLNPTMPEYGRINKVTDKIKDLAWYKKAVNNSGVPFWYDGDIEDQGNALYLIQYVDLVGARSHAVLTIKISDNYFSSLARNSKYEYLLGLDFKQVIRSSQHEYIGNEIPFQINGSSGISNLYYETINGKKAMVMDFSIYGTNTGNEFQLIILNACMEDIYEMLRGYLLILIIAVFLPMILIITFSNKYSTRVRTVRDEMHKVALGNLQIQDTVGGRDELGELFEDMKLTIQSIQKLHEQVYMEQLNAQKLENEQQQIQFELLSDQINPHFLFNTLESIRMHAILDDNTKLAQIIMQLGKMLRFSLENKQKPISLLVELNQLEVYFDIQRFRFPDKKCTIHIQPNLDVSCIDVLPLLLQPLVENCFRHGLKGVKGNAAIDVSVLCRNGILYLSVTDNGVGMSKEKLDELYEKMNYSAIAYGRSIGICNVYSRIKLFYGLGYGMDIASEPGKGTSITLRIPCVRNDQE